MQHLDLASGYDSSVSAVRQAAREGNRRYCAIDLITGTLHKALLASAKHHQRK